MTSLVFIYGGITLADMLKALVVLLATAITLGVIAVSCSGWLGRTARATAISYLATLGLLIGPLLLYKMVCWRALSDSRPVGCSCGTPLVRSITIPL